MRHLKPRCTINKPEIGHKYSWQEEHKMLEPIIGEAYSQCRKLESTNDRFKVICTPRYINVNMLKKIRAKPEFSEFIPSLNDHIRVPIKIRIIAF
jgi:hypothetical protein